MSFAWPWALLALALVPILLGMRWWLRRRRRKGAVRVSSVALVRTAMPVRSRWTRRIPAALLVLGLIVLGTGVARPQATVAVPSDSTTILLAIDVSGSMCSTDVAPNRITVAERAAATFIRSQEGRTRIGLVAFSGVAAVLVPPTSDTSRLLGALQDLSTGRGTAIGEAILTSIDAIADVDPAVPPTGVTPRSTPAGYAADAIVVLTDGANTQGVLPSVAARQAALRHIRVFTIGFGTTTPAPLVCSGSQFGGFGGVLPPGGGAFPGVNPLIIDESALKQVASSTGGQYYRAQNADQLQGAMAQLPKSITTTTEHRDIAAWFAGAGGLLVAAAVGLSLWWNRPRVRRSSGAASGS